MHNKTFLFDPYFKHPGGGKVAQVGLIKILTSINSEIELSTNLFSLYYRIFNSLFKGHQVILIEQGVFSIGYILIDFLSKYFNIKLIIIPRGDYIPTGNENWIVKNKKLKLFLWEKFIKYRLRNANYVVFTSQLECDRYFNLGLSGFSRTVIIPDIFNIKDRFNLMKNKCSKQLKISYPYFLFVGRVSAEKNLIFLVDVYIKIFEHFQSTTAVPHLVFFVPSKSGSYYKSLKKKIIMNNLSKFIHFLTEDDCSIECAYNSCILNLLPSHTESFGLTVLEALAFGKKSIVSENCPWYYSNKDFVYPVNLNIDRWADLMLSEFNNTPSKLTPKFIKNELNNYRLDKQINKWSKVLIHG